MGFGFARLPDGDSVTLAGARAPQCLLAEATGEPDEDGVVAVDIRIEAGRIAAVTPAGAAPVAAPVFAMDGGMVWPCFVEAHTHLDKGHIWPRARNPDGSFPGALATVGIDRAANWTAEDVRARMTFALQCAYAHGTAAIRTHLDSPTPQMPITWPVFAEMREEWAGRVDLQGSSLIGVDMAAEPGYVAAAAATVKAHGGVLGCVTYMSPNLPAVLEALFTTALAEGLSLDFHVDESLDPGAASLGLIAQAAIRHDWRGQGNGRILAGHCCSLSIQDEATVDRTLDLVAEAGVAVVSLPLCNLYLQDRRAGLTPRRRGVTLLHEMKARGVPVLVSSDNTRDPFYAYGDLDALEVYRGATRIAHLDHPVGDWPRAITATPAEVCGFSGRGVIAAGGPADLVLFRARRFTELLSRPQADRTVLRRGRAIDTSLPDYRVLDEWMEKRP